MTKFTESNLRKAIDSLKLLKYFPADPAAHGALMELLTGMCPDLEALDWLVAELMNHVGEWPGPANVRGLLCQRCKPADGIETDCGIPGYTPADCEARAIREHQGRKALEIGSKQVLLERLVEFAPKMLDGVKDEIRRVPRQHGGLVFTTDNKERAARDNGAETASFSPDAPGKQSSEYERFSAAPTVAIFDAPDSLKNTIQCRRCGGEILEYHNRVDWGTCTCARRHRTIAESVQ
jgi:hypothetical protein